jgi:hypothetical protein
MIVAAIVFGVLAVLATIRYRITHESLEVLVLGRVARRVLLADIEEVHRRGAFIRESWCGLKFWNSVTIRRRSGILRNFLISPDDPDRFAERLRESARLAAGGSGPGLLRR